VNMPAVSRLSAWMSPVISSPRQSGIATMERICPPRIDSEVASSSAALAVRMAARSSRTRRSTARLARIGSTVRRAPSPVEGARRARPSRWRASATVKRSLSLSERSRTETCVARGRSWNAASTTASSVSVISTRVDSGESAL